MKNKQEVRYSQYSDNQCIKKDHSYHSSFPCYLKRHFLNLQTFLIQNDMLFSSGNTNVTESQWLTFWSCSPWLSWQLIGWAAAAEHREKGGGGGCADTVVTTVFILHLRNLNDCLNSTMNWSLLACKHYQRTFKSLESGTANLRGEYCWCRCSWVCVSCKTVYEV